MPNAQFIKNIGIQQGQIHQYHGAVTQVLEHICVDDTAAFGLVCAQGLHFYIANGALNNDPIHFIEIICTICSVISRFFTKGHHYKAFIHFRHF